jgi:hypothetical protein
LKGKYHDLLAATDQHAAAMREFYLDVSTWKKLKTSAPLVWDRVRFMAGNKSKVPKERGIYVFGLTLEPSPIPTHGYIMYVGIAGDSPNGNLHKRYGNYLDDLRRQDGRPKVYEMLARWKGHLFFNFAVLDANVDLRKLETAFLDALRPPVNTADFSAEVAAARKAAW